jgi:hypothetical protein
MEERLTPRAAVALALTGAVMSLRPPLHRGLLAAPFHGNPSQLELAKEPHMYPALGWYFGSAVDIAGGRTIG